MDLYLQVCFLFAIANFSLDLQINYYDTHLNGEQGQFCGRAPDSWLKSHRFESVPSPWVILAKMQVAGYS